MPIPSPAPTSTAVITGASSGIGEEFARQLAARGHGVTLVARRVERLEALARRLTAAHGVRAQAVPADLTDPASVDTVADATVGRGLDVEILVNNAGFGIYTTFAARGIEREQEQLDVLVNAVLRLTGRFLAPMLDRGRGAIVNMASTSGFQPIPGNGTYAACKAFVLLHSEALAEEVRPKGVTVTAVCPGPVRTEFQETSEPLFVDRVPGFAWVSVERVVRDSLVAVEKGRRSVIPGGLPVKALFGPNRFIPSAIVLPVARKLMSRELSG